MFPIVRNFWLFATISFSAFVISVISLSTWGLNLGIDFTGGVMWQNVSTSSSTNYQDLTTTMQNLGNQFAKTKVLPTKNNTFTIKIPYTSDKILNAAIIKLKAKYPDFQIGQKLLVGPIIGKTLKKKAFIALTITLIVIVLFLSISFHKVPEGVSPWHFGGIAILALIHDITIIIGIFVFLGHYFNIEIDQLFVIALLTILGYSVNDTIVIFDRIRENLLNKKLNESIAKITENSLWQTMRRSINTSLTVVIVLVALLIWGPDSIFYFIIALLLGTIIGTYSSIFIAGPLLAKVSK